MIKNKKTKVSNENLKMATGGVQVLGVTVNYGGYVNLYSLSTALGKDEYDSMNRFDLTNIMNSPNFHPQTNAEFKAIVVSLIEAYGGKQGVGNFYSYEKALMRTVIPGWE